MDCFAEWCKPGRDYSPKIAGMVLACLAINDSSLLNQLSKLAHTDNMKTACAKAKQLIIDSLLNAEIHKHIDELGPAKQEFLRLLEQAKAKASRTK